MTTTIELPGADGLTLVGDAFGDPAGQPVLLLHGGGQTRHAWGKAGRHLAANGFYALSVDQRGHGESSWDAEGRYGFEDFAADLLVIVDHFRAPPAVVGASLGGLAALLAHGDSPDEPPFSALVLVDVAHRAEADGVSRIIEFMQSRVDEGFASLEEVAAAVAGYLPHRPRPTDLGGLAKNLRLGSDGRYRWHWDPAFLRRHRGRRVAELRASARTLTVPTMLVRGRLSDVLSETVAREFMTLAPHAEYVNIDSAAHMIAGDRNDIFSETVVDFLRRTFIAVR